MKLDILKKLIALANNNPNDNEANFAARKACKALVEHKYIEQLTDIVKVPNNPPPRPTPPKSPPKSPSNTANTGYYNPFEGSYYDPFEEYFKYKETNKTKREPPPNPGYTQHEGISDELKERQNSWQYESVMYSFGNPKYWNPITRKYYYYMFQDKWYEETGQRHSSDTKEFRQQANYGNPYESKQGPYTYNKTGKAEDEKYYKRKKDRGFGDDVRKLKCKTCGQVKNTRFVGLAEVFECNECQWEAYTKEKPKESKAANRTCTSCRTPISCIASNYCQKQGVNI